MALPLKWPYYFLLYLIYMQAASVLQQQMAQESGCKTDTSHCVAFASLSPLRFAVKSKASTVQTVPAVAGPAVSLH